MTWDSNEKKMTKRLFKASFAAIVAIAALVILSSFTFPEIDSLAALRKLCLNSIMALAGVVILGWSVNFFEYITEKNWFAIIEEKAPYGPVIIFSVILYIIGNLLSGRLF